MSKYLMCTPTYYSVEYEINPWMKIENSANNYLARQQWQRLIQILHNLNATVLEMSGIEHLPDIVFTANAAVIKNQTAVLANFAYPERQKEKNHYKHWFESNNYNVIEISENLLMEGAGDALFGTGPLTNNILFCGYGFRSQIEAHQELGQLLQTNIISCKLINPYFYHIDTCFCPLSNDMALICPTAFDQKSLSEIRSCFKHLIEVPEQEAQRFACNAVQEGNTVIMPNQCPKTKSLLNSVGFNVIDCDMSEFHKSGGSVKCCTLQIG